MKLADDTPRKRLRDLLPEAVYLPPDSDPRFAAVATDPAAVAPGDVYVHLDPAGSSGAEAAAARGAAAVISERLLPLGGVTQVVVADSRAAHRRLVASIADSRTASGPVVVAVGGDAGAEHAATLLAAIHAHAGEAVGLLTQRVIDDGEHCLVRRETTPRTASSWLRRCALGGVATAIAEATPASPLGETPLVATLVSLRCDQLDQEARPRWPSVAAHRAAVLGALGPLDAGVTLVASADEPAAARVAASHPGRVITFGDSAAADVRSVTVESHGGGQSVIVTIGSESACVGVPTPGRAARRETLAAIATAYALGFDARTTLRGIELAPRFAAVAEPVACGQPFSVLLDRAMRPLELADAADAASWGGGRLLATLRLAEVEVVARRQVATLAKMADRVFAYGAPLGGEVPANVTVVEDGLAAMAVALGLADDGDSVLLAGARGRDRVTAIKLLRRRLECEGRRAAA